MGHSPPSIPLFVPADRLVWEHYENNLRMQSPQDVLERTWESGRINDLDCLLDEMMIFVSDS